MCFENSHCQFENTVEIFWDLESSNWSISPKAKYGAILGYCKIIVFMGKLQRKIYFGTTMEINCFKKPINFYFWIFYLSGELYQKNLVIKSILL